MYILYLDESGCAANPAEEHFVIAGVAVPESELHFLTNELNSIAESIDSNNPDAVEFHASEIFGGRNEPWSGIEKTERIEIIKKVLRVAQKTREDTAVFASVIDKQSYPDDPTSVAFEDICSRFDIFLNRQYKETGYSHKGIIVFDQNSYEVNLRKRLKSLRSKEEGTRWGNHLRNIREMPFFIDSKTSRIIQLADHIAYATLRNYNSNDTNYFSEICGKIDSVKGTLHGLSHKTRKTTCFCPSCAQKRLTK